MKYFTLFFYCYNSTKPNYLIDQDDTGLPQTEMFPLLALEVAGLLVTNLNPTPNTQNTNTL